MSTIDLKGLDNTSSILKLVYNKNRSKRETKEKGSNVESPLSPTASQMTSSYLDV